MGANLCSEPIDRALRSHVLNLSESPLETWEDVLSALEAFQGVPIVGTVPPAIAAKRKEEDQERKRILKGGGVNALGEFKGFILSSLVLTSIKRNGARIPRSFVEHDCFLNLRHLQLANCKLVSIDAFALLSANDNRTDYDATDTEKLTEIFQALAASAEFDAVKKSAKQYPLETLNVSHNKLARLPPGLFCRFPKLVKLVASNNEISFPTTFYPHLWQGATHLTHLYLGANNISSVDFLFSDTETVSCLPVLHEVDLLGNRIKTVGPFDGSKPIRPLPELRVLDLQQQGDPTGATLKKREAERTKFLKKRQITDLTAEELASLKEIQLRVGGATSLKTIDPEIYNVCPGLHHLRIEGNADEPDLRAFLSETAQFKDWRERRAEMVSKQIRAGVDVKLQ